MTHRQQTLMHIRVAGFHDDSRTFTRLYVENRIALPAALAEFRTGQAQKEAGGKCYCIECREPAAH